MDEIEEKIGHVRRPCRRNRVPSFSPVVMYVFRLPPPPKKSDITRAERSPARPRERQEPSCENCPPAVRLDVDGLSTSSGVFQSSLRSKSKHQRVAVLAFVSLQASLSCHCRAKNRTLQLPSFFVYVTKTSFVKLPNADFSRGAWSVFRMPQYLHFINTTCT